MSAFKSTAMTRRDYETVAGVFALQMNAIDLMFDVDPTPEYGIVRTTSVVLARDMATKLASHDPGFKRDRFLRACGLKNADIFPDFCSDYQHPLREHFPSSIHDDERLVPSCALLLCGCSGYTPGLAS